VVNDRLFGDRQTACAGLHDHLGGELHPVGVTVHPVPRLPCEHAHPRVGVRDTCLVEGVEEPRQQGVADVLVERRHRAVFDIAVQPGSHRHVGVAVGDELVQLGKFLEVVGGVGVADSDVVAAAALERVLIRVPVPRLVGGDDDCAHRTGDLGRLVGRAVRDDHLREHAEILDGGSDHLDTLADPVFLVQRRHDEAESGSDVAVGGKDQFLARERCRVRRLRLALGRW